MTAMAQQTLSAGTRVLSTFRDRMKPLPRMIGVGGLAYSAVIPVANLPARPRSLPDLPLRTAGALRPACSIAEKLSDIGRVPDLGVWWYLCVRLASGRSPA